MGRDPNPLIAVILERNGKTEACVLVLSQAMFMIRAGYFYRRINSIVRLKAWKHAPTDPS